MSEPECRIIIIILAGVENRPESLSVDIKEVKASQDEIKNATTELQSRMDAKHQGQTRHSSESAI